MRIRSLYFFLTFALLIILYIPAFSIFPLKPTQLSCENILNPLGIDIDKPRLSWKFTTSGKDQLQFAYEIIVSDNESGIKNGDGNAWSSGKILSDQSVNVTYAGSPLKPFTRYYWRVKIHNDKNEVSTWSEPAWFETAMLSPSDWRAKWIGDGRKNPEHDADYFKADRMPLFRRGFSAPKTIKSARLYISGLGYYEAYLNGKKVGDNVLDPGWTTYSKQAFYVVHGYYEVLVGSGNYTFVSTIK